MATPAGLPRHGAFPRIGKGEIDYESQLVEFGRGIRSLRHTFLGVVLVTGLLAIALAISGRSPTATGLFLMVIVPLGLVLTIVEIVGLLRRRGRSG